MREREKQKATRSPMVEGCMKEKLKGLGEQKLSNAAIVIIVTGEVEKPKQFTDLLDGLYR